LADDDDDDDISRIWKSFRQNMKASATESQGSYDLKHHRPWSDEQWSELLDQNCNSCRVLVKQMDIIGKT